MKWFKKWFAKQCQEAWESAKESNQETLTSGRPIAVDRDGLNSHGMNFTVYRASGGHIVEHRVYDRKSDRNNTALHIITDDKDLGEEIGKIITFESLRS